MSLKNFSGPSETGIFFHSLDHLDASLRVVDVPEHPSMPFTTAWFDRYLQSLAVFAVWSFLVFVGVSVGQILISMCCASPRCCCISRKRARALSRSNLNLASEAARKIVVGFSIVWCFINVTSTSVLTYSGWRANAETSRGLTVIADSQKASYDLYLDLAKKGQMINVSANNCTDGVEYILGMGRPLPADVQASLNMLNNLIQGTRRDTDKANRDIKEADFGGQMRDLGYINEQRSKISLVTLALLCWCASWSLWATLHCMLDVQLCKEHQPQGVCDVSYGCVIRSLMYFFLIFVNLMCTAQFVLSVFVADFCMDPTKWAKAVVGRGTDSNNATMTQKLLNFYLDCDGSTINPLAQSLELARVKLDNTTASLDDLVFYARTRDPDLISPLEILGNRIYSMRILMSQIIREFDCVNLHNEAMNTFEGVCHPFLTGMLQLIGIQMLNTAMLQLAWPCQRVLRYYRATQDAIRDAEKDLKERGLPTGADSDDEEADIRRAAAGEDDEEAKALLDANEQDAMDREYKRLEEKRRREDAFYDRADRVKREQGAGGAGSGSAGGVGSGSAGGAGSGSAVGVAVGVGAGAAGAAGYDRVERVKRGQEEREKGLVAPAQPEPPQPAQPAQPPRSRLEDFDDDDDGNDDYINESHEGAFHRRAQVDSSDSDEDEKKEDKKRKDVVVAVADPSDPLISRPKRE